MDSYGHEFYDVLNRKYDLVSSHYKYPLAANEELNEIVNRLYLGSIILHCNYFLQACMDNYISEDYESIAERLELHEFETELAYLVGVNSSKLDDDLSLSYGSSVCYLLNQIYLPEVKGILREVYNPAEFYLSPLGGEDSLPFGFDDLAYYQFIHE